MDIYLGGNGWSFGRWKPFRIRWVGKDTKLVSFKRVIEKLHGGSVEKMLIQKPYHWLSINGTVHYVRISSIPDCARIQMMDQAWCRKLGVARVC